MKRKQLNEALRTASEASGYAFHSGPAHLLNGEVRIYPAVWLDTPVLTSAQGRTEGDITYRITVHIMELSAKPGEREQQWDKLEHDALTLARNLADDSRIRDVTAVKCTPAISSLTVHGEVSVTLSCDVTIWYSI